MDQKTEQEQPKPEVVKLNEEFALFDPQKTIKSKYDFSSQVVLDTSDITNLPNSPFGIYADDILPDTDEIPKTEALTPFEPELGYRITGEDLDPKRRPEKIKGLEGQLLDKTKAPLVLIIAINSVVLDHLGLSKTLPTSSDNHPKDIFEFKNGVKETLEKLRVQLSFPNGQSFEAMPHDDCLDDGFLLLKNFYPLDTGPLTESLPYGPYYGLPLYLPNDPEKLSQIRGRFIMIKEANEQNQPREENDFHLNPDKNQN